MNRLPLALLLLLGGPSWASSSAGTGELLSEVERVPPVILFVVDLSQDMDTPCSTAATESCLESTVEAIQQIARHFEGSYGVIGTSSGASDDAYYPIVPVGSSYAEMAAALSTLTTHGTATRNLAEVIESASESYLKQSTPDDGVDNDGDGFTGDWGESPVGYSCTNVHFVTFARERPVDDDQVDFSYSSASNMTVDEVACDVTGIVAFGSDQECFYDNVTANVYNTDVGGPATDTQNAIVHTIGLGITSGSIAEALFNNAATNTAAEGTYTNATSQEEILSGILAIFSEIYAGTYSRSAPVVTAAGDYLIYTFYEMTGTNPLAEGHIRAYALDDDPSSSTYGEVLYEGDAAYGGAVWDGGDLLVSRPVTASENNPDDRDGVGKRDIYTFEDFAYTTAMGLEADTDRRMGFDYDFVQAINSTVLDFYLDTSETGPEAAYDLNGDEVVTQDDLQSLVDFARGLPEAEFRYISMERGRWKLGDSPYSVPVVVSARDNRYTSDRTYQAFLAELAADEVPTIVLLAANDGMLHAFRLEDDPLTTTEDESGEELWAWVPGYLLLRDKEEEWANSLIDLMWYGKTFLFDGSPVVQDVWIDDDGDGVKTVGEFHRVVVVQQGMGGPVTLALDITDPMSPDFLWEQKNPTDTTAQGYGTGRPAIFNVYDARDPVSPDQWVAMWGGGRAPGYAGASGTNYWQSSEANLYMWNMGDDAWSTENVGYTEAGDNIGSMYPDLDTNLGGQTWAELEYNADSTSNLENGYISAGLAVVDVDSDGDADVMYFPVTTSYRPTDEGGGGIADPEDPGSSWIFKAIIDENQPDDLTWCEFYDPRTGTDGTNGIGARPEVFYAATAAWLTDGNLGVYWGTGTPYDRSGSETGYFFAMYDEDPLECTSTAQPISCNGDPGYYPLESGEGLTSEPVVFASTVYFTTYTPDADRCEAGDSRVYGIGFDDCLPGIDTDGVDGVTSSDSPYIEVEDTFVSGITIGDGKLYYGSATPSTDGDAVVEIVDLASDPFLGTAAIAWMEIY
jgi:hypothetical protein